MQITPRASPLTQESLLNKYTRAQVLMSTKVLVSICGSRSSRVYELGLKIKEEIGKTLPHTITVIDLNSKSKNEQELYSPNDYDFDEIYSLVSQEGPELEIVLLCGCYALGNEKINKISHLKVFVDTEGDRRLINLIRNSDLKSPSDLSSLLDLYMDRLRPEYHEFIESTRAEADLIIPSANETLGLSMIIDGVIHVVEELQDGGYSRRRQLPHLDFQLERMDVEKGRYYDLS